MSLSYRSIRSILLGIVAFFIIAGLVLAANSVGFFGNALEPFVGPFVGSTSLTAETFTAGTTGTTGTTGSSGRSGVSGTTAGTTSGTGGTAVRPTPTVRR
jgi:hypothetical protein